MQFNFSAATVVRVFDTGRENKHIKQNRKQGITKTELGLRTFGKG